MRSSYGVVCHETSTLSTDGRSWLRLLIWLPDPTYTKRGVVQLVHGMSEHVGRYDRFARFLAGLGYVVFGHDQVGHGKSVSSQRNLGHMPLAGGADILVDDVRRVREVALSSMPHCGRLPFFLFGHSMGSFIVRVFAARYPEDLSGLVLCGTGNQPRALMQAGRALCRVLALGNQGDRGHSRFVESLVMRTFQAGIDNPRTDFDWLSHDPDVVDAFCADPLTSSHLTLGGYATLLDVIAKAVSKDAFAALPHALPILLVSGEEDPVGEMGKAVQKAADLYKKQGMQDVQVKLYPGMRHEILNEPDVMQVFSDIESWFTQHAILQGMKQNA